jgi:hypothetical protein
MKVVFVHLGPAKAPHLKKNIAHIKRNFPNSQITLITSSDAHTSLTNLKSIDNSKYTRIEEVSRTIDSLEHNPKFRKGFWLYSLERIYALRQWAATHPDEAFLHIESDILLMKDFPMKKVFEMKSLAWTRHSEGADVATFLYSPNFREIDWVSAQITDIVKTDKNSTDMSALSRISMTNPERVHILPSNIESTQNMGENKESVEYFGGIFDPATYGMWLTGQDPRNNLGIIRKFISVPGDVNPANYRYITRPLGTLKIVRDGKEFSLFNLHLHNKRLSLFGRLWTLYLAIDVLNSHRRLIKSTIAPRAMWAILTDVQSRLGLFTPQALKVFFRHLRTMRNQ